ncbi:unnamed protein product [Linum tenue]|uniref:Uncharacterized protein n=1 Tax=Linum tenue TaxID=586396 RepID=A0AAV0N148_9ROSI|nr:unnamed protein product [Linum tenue]
MGPADGDSVPRVDGRVSQPLRVELCAGELERGSSDRGVAAGGGARVQCEDAGGGDEGGGGDGGV